MLLCLALNKDLSAWNVCLFSWSNENSSVPRNLALLDVFSNHTAKTRLPELHTALTIQLAGRSQEFFIPVRHKPLYSSILQETDLLLGHINTVFPSIDINRSKDRARMLWDARNLKYAPNDFYFKSCFALEDERSVHLIWGTRLVSEMWKNIYSSKSSAISGIICKLF